MPVLTYVGAYADEPEHDGRGLIQTPNASRQCRPSTVSPAGRYSQPTQPL